MALPGIKPDASVENMNILFDARLLGRGGLSGIEEYTTQLLAHLLSADKENDYTVFYNGLRKQPLTNRIALPPHTRVVDWRFPNKLLDASSRFLRAPAIDSLIKTDLVFSPHFNTLISRHTPHIITFHDLSFIHHPDFFNLRQRFWHWLQGYRRQAGEADHLVANSFFTKNDLVTTLGIRPEKITVIYEGVNPALRRLKLPHTELSDFRQKHGLTGPYILFVGTLEPRKNIRALIRAFNLIRSRFREPLRLVLAGRPGWLYGTILKEAVASPHKEDILFFGRVSENEKLYLYNGATAFVYPSFFEGFGLPPLEAQTCGCPVVVSDRTSLPEVVGRGALFVNPWRPVEIADALTHIFNNGKVREELVRAGFENSARFSWQEAARSTLNLFKKIYASHHS